MLPFRRYLFLLCAGLVLFTVPSWAQGPPILGDKPIMLGAKRWIFKTLTAFHQLEQGHALRAPLMVHYLPTSTTLVGLHVPLVTYQLPDHAGTALGDVQLLGKYQFYRKDGKGKTFKMVVKTLQTLPTGPRLALDLISTGQYQGFYSILVGYESLRYGLLGESGFNWSALPFFNEWRTKASVGLPLLKPKYPVRQVNLYFEYQSSYFTAQQRYLLLYAQGIQYAHGPMTVEAAVQLPLVQTLLPEMRRRYSLYLGLRYVL